jgi:hypothetical protein
MAKQCARRRWSRFIAALVLVWRVLGLAGRIPLDLWLRHARYWFQRWPELVAASAVAAENLEPYQAVYRHRVVSAARLRLEEIQVQTRIQLAVLLTGFAVVWLIARVLHLLDPAYGNTWDRVHNVLSPRSPSEKP